MWCLLHLHKSRSRNLFDKEYITTATIQEKAEKALKSAVRKLVRERKKTGESLYVWRNGKVAKVLASQLVRKRA